MPNRADPERLVVHCQIVGESLHGVHLHLERLNIVGHLLQQRGRVQTPSTWHKTLKHLDAGVPGSSLLSPLRPLGP